MTRSDRLLIVSGADTHLFPVAARHRPLGAGTVPASGDRHPRFRARSGAARLAHPARHPSRPSRLGYRLPRPRAYCGGAFKAQFARPFLPRHFPGYETYLWIDADAWLQDWRAVELYVAAACGDRLAITPGDRPRLQAPLQAAQTVRADLGVEELSRPHSAGAPPTGSAAIRWSIAVSLPCTRCAALGGLGAADRAGGCSGPGFSLSSRPRSITRFSPSICRSIFCQLIATGCRATRRPPSTPRAAGLSNLIRRMRRSASCTWPAASRRTGSFA